MLYIYENKFCQDTFIGLVKLGLLLLGLVVGLCMQMLL